MNVDRQSVTALQDMGAKLGAMREQRNDLLAACKTLIVFAKSVRPAGRVLESDPDFDSIFAIIDKAEGGAA